VRLAVVWFIVKAVFSGSGRPGIGGYDAQGMLVYYIAAILVGKLVQTTELEQGISQDIYEGALTRYLLYPVPYGVVKYVQQLGALGPAIVQLVLFGAWLPFVVGIPRGFTPAGIAMGLGAIAVVSKNGGTSEEETKWGFIDKAGKFVINPQFDEAMSFNDGLARVKLGRKIGYIDATGKYVWNPTN